VHGCAAIDQRREQLGAVIIIDSLADKSCVLRCELWGLGANGRWLDTHQMG